MYFFPQKLVIFLSILSLSLLSAKVSCSAEGALPSTFSKNGGIIQVPGYASLYRQTLRIPLFKKASINTVKVESNLPPKPGNLSNYLKITADEVEIYNFSGTGQEQAEFIGSCTDSTNQRTQIIIREHPSYRGKQSRYIFLAFDDFYNRIIAKELADTVPLSSIFATKPHLLQHSSQNNKQSDILPQPTAATVNCTWQEIQSLSTEIYIELSMLRSNTPSPFAGGKRISIGKPQKLTFYTIDDNRFTLIRLTKNLIERGDNRHALELLDGGDLHELYAVAYDSASKTHLDSAESIGIVLLHDKNDNIWQPLFKLESRPYPYEGFCKTTLSFRDEETLYGWLAKGTQPCKYYPVIVDLKKAEYSFMSDKYTYDISSERFPGAEINTITR